jgi:hypothetical protein
MCTNLTENGELCGESGVYCDPCFQREIQEHLWMRGVSLGAVTGKQSEQDKIDLRDAGRGHLVKP